MKRTVERVNLPHSAPPRLLRVAAYARVSSGKDAMLHSLAAQVSYYSKLIQEHKGWSFAGVYSDEALTGTKADRADFQALLAECRAGHIDLVLTKSISRFARNTVTLLQTVRELKALGVDVYFEEQKLHTIGPDGELLLTILASYAQAESYSASENAKWRVRKGFEQGELINWRHMFGYEIDRDGIHVNEAEAEMVRQVFQRFLAGESLNALAKFLNDSGFAGKLGGRWSWQRIRKLLSNEKYLGNALLMKQYRNNHLEKRLVMNRGELPMYYAEGTHEAIVDEVTFQLAQERLKELEEANAGRQPPSHSAFSGRITCGQCGGKYRRITRGKFHYWNCATAHGQGTQACPGHQIREDVLFRAAADALGLVDSDDQAFRAQIVEVEADASQLLTFRLQDDRTVEIPWQMPSRRDSWTPEMRAAARERRQRKEVKTA